MGGVLMAWSRRGFVIYPANLVDIVPNLKQNVATLFAQAGGLESVESEMAMFDNATRLTADGLTVTHRCINTMQNPAMNGALKQAFLARQAELVGLVWFVVDADTSVLLDTNTGAVLGQVFTVDDAYAYVGVTVYQEALE